MAKTEAKVKVILGSGSRTRREILTEMGYTFEIKKADIDESAIRRDVPEDLVRVLAEAKAKAIIEKLRMEGAHFVAEEYPHTLLITGDQVVVHNERILEKPINEIEAREFIEGYSSSPAQTVGSVMVTNLNTGFEAIGVDSARVYFHLIPKETVDALVEFDGTYASAGGLMVEHPLVSPFVKAIEGTMDSVMGLPKHLTQKLIDKASVLDRNN